MLVARGRARLRAHAARRRRRRGRAARRVRRARARRARRRSSASGVRGDGARARARRPLRRDSRTSSPCRSARDWRAAFHALHRRPLRARGRDAPGRGRDGCALRARAAAHRCPRDPLPRRGRATRRSRGAPSGSTAAASPTRRPSARRAARRLARARGPRSSASTARRPSSRPGWRCAVERDRRPRAGARHDERAIRSALELANHRLARDRGGDGRRARAHGAVAEHQGAPRLLVRRVRRARAASSRRRRTSPCIWARRRSRCARRSRPCRMAPGDVVVLNDPFAGGTHLPDVTVVRAGVPPRRAAAVRVRREPRASRRHRRHGAGLDAGRHRHLPGGRPDPADPASSPAASVVDDVLALFLANTRVAARAARAISTRSAAALRVGATRLARARRARRAARRGSRATSRALQDYAERLMRAALRRAAGGHVSRDATCSTTTASARAACRSRVAITLRGGRARVDFAGTAPQVARPGERRTSPCTRSAVLYVFAALAGGERADRTTASRGRSTSSRRRARVVNARSARRGRGRQRRDVAADRRRAAARAREGARPTASRRRARAR